MSLAFSKVETKQNMQQSQNIYKPAQMEQKIDFVNSLKNNEKGDLCNQERIILSFVSFVFLFLVTGMFFPANTAVFLPVMFLPRCIWFKDTEWEEAGY